MKKILLVLLLAPLLVFAKKKSGSYYQLSVYHFADRAQENALDEFVGKALVPAYHRAGIATVGVFKAIANDTAEDKKLFILIPFSDFNKLEMLEQGIAADNNFKAAGQSFLNAAFDHPDFTRKEVIMLKAFPMAQQIGVPALKGPKSERVYELRSYESSSQQYHVNKMKMFNDGDEIGIFKKLGFNAVFYSSVIAGGKMPNLMYMTSFENMADRDAHWKAFGSDPAWKTLSALPEYQHNVSHIDITFLRPTDYSDL